MASIQEAMQQAQAAAAAMPQENTGGQVVEASVSQGGVATTMAKPSMATVAASTGVIPRNTPYLKVNEDGIKVGKDKTYFEGFKGKVLLEEDAGFMVKHTIRFGNPAQYLSTYDGVVCDKGGSWGDAMTKAKLADPKAEPYPAVDVVIVLTEDLKLKDEVLKAGSKVAFTSSKTNFSEWQDFYGEASKAGVVGQEVDVEIGHKAISYNGNDWGVVTFTLL